MVIPKDSLDSLGVPTDSNWIPKDSQWIINDYLGIPEKGFLRISYGFPMTSILGFQWNPKAFQWILKDSLGFPTDSAWIPKDF